jgi:quaternary ammonium compound-resistance protein SugE
VSGIIRLKIIYYDLLLILKFLSGKNMVWVYLLIAGFFEIGWSIGLKYSAGFTNLLPTVWTVITMILTYVFLSLATKTLPIGTAYAVWTGIGTTGTAILGIILFNEPKDLMRLFFILLIITGTVGLKMYTH